MGNYYLYTFGRFLANILPVGLSRAVVTLLCDMHFCFSRRDRRSVENNLKIIQKANGVPSKDARAVFRYFGLYLFEFFTMTKRLRPEFIKEHVQIKNIEYLNEILRKGKGGILVSAHLGNWEMGGAILSMLGFPLSVVALPHKDSRVNALFNAQREAFGARVIQTDVAVRRVAEHLHQNRLVAILAERDFGQHGLVMDFFGTKAMIPKGAAFFSLKMGTPIIPIFFIRRDHDDFQIVVYPPIDPPHLSAVKITEDIAIPYVQKYLKIIEDEIRKNPTQWLLFREIGEL